MRNPFLRKIQPFVLVLFILLCSTPLSRAAKEITLQSPDGHIRFRLFTEKNRLSWNTSLDNKTVINASPLAMLIDKVDLTKNAKQAKVENYSIDESFPMMGFHSKGMNQCNGMRITYTQKKGSQAFILDVRAYNTGIAFRFVLPGEGKTRTPDEASSFALPAGSTVWFHNLDDHYQGPYQSKPIEQLQPGEWCAPPVTLRLADFSAYVCLTEAALFNYSGMALRADGHNGLSVRLAHSQPVSTSFKQNYTDAEVKNLAVPAQVTGTITTPWRVAIIGRELNDLFNSDMIYALCPGPDSTLFPFGPATSWIIPGRASQKGSEAKADHSPKAVKEFIRQTGKIGLEYTVLDGWWVKWSEKELKDVIKFAGQQRVGIWLWKSAKDLANEEQRTDFFKKCSGWGIKGLRVDQFDSETKDMVELYTAILRDAAKNKLMIDFRGCNKPTGEARTWPNELGRPAVTGMDDGSISDRASHDVILPFTRMIAGITDYMPMQFSSKRGNTTWAHQLAGAVILGSPLLTFSSAPSSILANPALSLIRSIPSSWDEVVVLGDSGIGDLAVMAFRSGKTWFLAVMSNGKPHTFKVPLTFLGQGDYETMLAGDDMSNPASLKIENTTLRKSHIIEVQMSAGGGFLARFIPDNNQQ